MHINIDQRYTSNPSIGRNNSDNTNVSDKGFNVSICRLAWSDMIVVLSFSNNDDKGVIKGRVPKKWFDLWCPADGPL